MHFTYNRTIRFADTDAAKVVYFANVLSICHEAYEAALEAFGMNIQQFFGNSSAAFPIVHSRVDFFRPMFCGDKLAVNLIPSRLGVDKFEISYEILVNDVVTAKAITRHVCIDVNSRSKQELTEEMIQWLENNRSDAEISERRRLREEIM
ncbi:acyl-CoA thioesterase [Fortiea contorta]|uniref:acyl-CoA thioesterase n=1 Tax=Fortiea contorta TaxID=1892405 RepID=UPI00034A24C7|nr:thioesterase family protein [Fortiea contorta]